MDYDSDGRLDLIAGDYDGKVHLYINIGTAADPMLTDAGYVQVNGQDLSVGYYSDPTVFDWNDDGLFDLLVGAGDGRLSLLLNDGTLMSPHFSNASFVQDGGAILTVDGGSAAPQMADLDGDGLADLVVGEYEGRVKFYQNQGAAGAPLFSGHTELAVSGRDIHLSSYTRPCLVDWNNDGGIDVVVGHYLGWPTLYLNDPQVMLLPQLSVQFNGPYMIPHGGGTVSFDVTVGNPHADPVTFDFYTTVSMAGRGFIGPVLNHQGITLGAGEQLSRTFTQYVPGRLPFGNYDYAVFIGDSSAWQFFAARSFYFFKY